MKLGLNLFVGQLIGIVSLLVLFCLGIMLAFFYTNERTLKNNEDLINEEIERNRLNQTNILLSVARQAEKGFYAEQTEEDAEFLLQSLNKAYAIVQGIEIMDQDDADNDTAYNKFLFKSITSNIKEYRLLFEQSLILWKQRGYSRNSGLGLKLKDIAYNGLRSHLSSYQTGIIQTHIYRLRWLEYEYYSYGKKYIPKLIKQIQILLNAIKQYQSAFSQLVKLDKKITTIKIKITHVFGLLTVDIDKAIKQEQYAMLGIQQRMSSENIQNSRINFLVTISIIILAIFLVRLMVRKLGKKVKQIGDNLESISDGKLDIAPIIPPEYKRDELDWINFYVLQLAKSLSKSMGSLEKQNYKLKLVSSKLSKYLSPQVYQSIFSGQQAVHIQSKRKKLSIFFSDIVSFTHTTENMESEDLTKILNDYLNEMSKIALEYGGTIDKFIGDAIMIFFGDPESKGYREDCLACVSMALAMRNKMDELAHQWKEEQGFSQPFKIRMGISSGYCTVGNFGSEERMDYTIIGGQVNLASRLESHAKPNQILISHEAYTLVKDKINCKLQDEIQAKGISTPIQAYQVINYRHSIEPPLNFSTSGNGYLIQINEKSLPRVDRGQLILILKKMIKNLT